MVVPCDAPIDKFVGWNVGQYRPHCAGLTIAVSALTFVHALQSQRLPWVASTSTVNLTAPQ